jgi:hypothetical protein
MNTQKDPQAKEGMRVKIISMVDDPNPIPKDTLGTISLIDDAGVIHVNWDNGRRLGMIPGVDEYILEPDLENVFDKLSEQDSGKIAIKNDIKKTPSVVSKSMPKPTKMSSNVKSSLKSSGIKTDKVTKNFKSANISDIKVESEEDIDYMTGAGGAATGAASSSGAYVGPMGATKPTFGKGPLTKDKGVTKPGPLHPKNENIFTKADLISEITNSDESGWYDDTRFEAWADKNKDGWRWNDTPAYHKEGVIIDPLTKISATWDDDNLDISKKWGAYQDKIKKENVFKIVKKLLNESIENIFLDNDGDGLVKGSNYVYKGKVSKKSGTPTTSDDEESTVDVKLTKCTKDTCYFEVLDDDIKKRGFNTITLNLLDKEPNKTKKHVFKKNIEETTTFNSVFGSGFPVVPAFAAKKGQWKTAKKPIWKGGKIVQQVENSGMLNPINEVNTVKYNKGGKFVKIKKKCTKFPYCSQGALDKPLEVSTKVSEPGSYVEEQLMKNIHEVAKMTGKSFQEVYNIVKNKTFIK